MGHESASSQSLEQQKDAFIRALVAAISQPRLWNNSKQYRGPIADTIRNSDSWEKLFIEIKISINQAVKSKDNITRMALARIERALKVIYDPNAKYFSIPRHNIFPSTTLKSRTGRSAHSNSKSSSLSSSMMRSLMRNGTRCSSTSTRGASPAKNRYDGNNVSIIEDLISREIRATGSRLVIDVPSHGRM